MSATMSPTMANVPQTSLGAHVPFPNEVTVQFRRWYAHANTAYQRGQQAGFPAPVAEEMVRKGVGLVVPQVEAPRGARRA